MASPVGSGERWPARLTLAAVGLAIGITIIVCGAFVRASVRALDSDLTQARVAQSLHDATASLRARMFSAETAQRNYLLSGAGHEQAAFRHARQDAQAALARVIALAKGNSWLTSGFGLLAMLTEARLAALEKEAAVVSARVPAMAPVPRGTMRADEDGMRAFAAASAAAMREAAAEQQRRMRGFHAGQRAISIEVLAGALVSAALFASAVLGLLFSRDRLLATRNDLRGEIARLTAMANHIRDGVAVFGANDKLLLWNRAFFPTIGFPPELERLGIPFARFSAAAADWFPPLLEEPKPRDEPVVAEMQRHGRVLEVWRSALADGGQIIAVADISKRVEAEQMVRQAQKMDALGQLTGGIAHDMNNLLQVISANLEQLAQRLPAQSGLRMRLDAAMAGVARGANLTRHLLAFARRQPLATEVIEPGELLRGTVELLRRTLGETYEVRLALDEEEERWSVRTDPQQLENAVLNLAINARDAMPNGGRVVMIVTNRIFDEEYVSRHSDAKEGEYVMIAVADTGQGMTAEQIAHAIEPFYTTKAAGRGTGLGLSMVYGFVRQSSGHFHIDSVQDGGTTVRLYLPRSMEPRSSAQARETPPHGRGETVLVVEDEPAVRAVVLGSLKDLGYQVLEAANAEAALALLKGGARPDLLFSDVVMPGGLGAAELARAARQLLPSLGVVFTSGYTDDRELGSDLGAEGSTVRLLAKPWTEDVLAASLRDALRSTGDSRASTPRLKILLVEDEPMVGETTAELLEAMGHEVRWASSVTEARSVTDRVELVITDAGLPDGDGADLAEELRRNNPELALIVISGRAARTLTASGVIWLEKPFDEAKLEAAIAEARAGVRAGAA